MEKPSGLIEQIDLPLQEKKQSDEKKPLQSHRSQRSKLLMAGAMAHSERMHAAKHFSGPLVNTLNVILYKIHTRLSQGNRRKQTHRAN